MLMYLSMTARQYALYVAAAVIPAIFLMRYIWKNDTVEKEPGSLLWACVLRGCLATALAFVLELLVDNLILPNTGIQTDMTYSIINATCVGLIEEFSKYFFLKRRTWQDPNFNYRYDGIVYAVFVSLGFAALENILYVFSYGLSVALSRALLAVPAHMGFAVFMGAFYGRAKMCDVRGDPAGRKINLLAGYLVAVSLHAFYDATAMINTEKSTIYFIIFVVLMYILVYNVVKRESRTDHRID
ncbi:MAG: PrsW family glutamic-type intramembrane protease [Bulleidia sp.]|nr:PrsW family glutamic-type intramembrane protease [Bulleidia sp.]